MAGNSDDLSARLKRISELTEQLMKMQEDTDNARELAGHIHREIALAREEVKQLSQTGHTRRRTR
jgi:hypothetical protein